jgi:outer membrane protein assembly factor BamB
LTTCGRKLFARMGSPVTAPPTNSVEKLLSKSQGFLMGYDLATEGKPLEGFPIRPESGEWSFEGTPVCDGGKLYVAMRRAEQGRCQLHVACFALTSGAAAADDAKDDSRPAGRMLWRTKICSAATLASGDFDELSHCLLTLDEGTLLVNSSLGVIGAVAADGGDVQWLQKYPRSSFRGGDPEEHDDQFFRDLTPCLPAGDLVICAPADCNRLFALDRTTGRFAWSTEPGVAADVVHLLGTSGQWLIASGDRLYWIDANTGRLLTQFPPGSLGAAAQSAASPRGLGRGVLAGDRVRFPTRESIFVFDQRPAQTDFGWQPKLIREIPLTPRGLTGGNLTIADGVLLIATGDRLVAFDEFGPK